GGNITNNLGCAMLEVGELDQAFELLKHATTLPADGPFEYGYRQYTLARAFERKQDFLNAARHCAKAFRHWRGVQGLNHPDYKLCVGLYADCLKKIGKRREYEKVSEAQRKLNAGQSVPPKAMPLIH